MKSSKVCNSHKSTHSYDCGVLRPVAGAAKAAAGQKLHNDVIENVRASRHSENLGVDDERPLRDLSLTVSVELKNRSELIQELKATHDNPDLMFSILRDIVVSYQTTMACELSKDKEHRSYSTLISGLGIGTIVDIDSIPSCSKSAIRMMEKIDPRNADLPKLRQVQEELEVKTKRALRATY